MSDTRLIPRGNALTEVMEVTTRDGVPWIAYIEGLPAEPRHRFLRQTVLPGRRLRFDSPTESRAGPELPAGSPFLPEWRLLRLLALSPLLPLGEPAEPPRALVWHRRRLARLARPASERVSRARLVRAVADLVHATRQAAETLVYGHRVRS